MVTNSELQRVGLSGWRTGLSNLLRRENRAWWALRRRLVQSLSSSNSFVHSSDSVLICPSSRVGSISVLTQRWSWKSLRQSLTFSASCSRMHSPGDLTHPAEEGTIGIKLHQASPSAGLTGMASGSIM